MYRQLINIQLLKIHHSDKDSMTIQSTDCLLTISGIKEYHGLLLKIPV